MWPDHVEVAWLAARTIVACQGMPSGWMAFGLRPSSRVLRGGGWCLLRFVEGLASGVAMLAHGAWVSVYYRMEARVVWQEHLLRGRC